VTNRPVNFSDPTGHKMTTDTPGEGGSCDSDCLNNLHKKHDKNKEKGSGGHNAMPEASALYDGNPPEWINILDGLKILWRSGPAWLFNETGRRIIMFDHPHGGVPFWHINTDIKYLPHIINIEPAVAVIGSAISLLKALGSTEIFVPIVFPHPDLFISPSKPTYNTYTT